MKLFRKIGSFIEFHVVVLLNYDFLLRFEKIISESWEGIQGAPSCYFCRQSVFMI